MRISMEPETSQPIPGINLSKDLMVDLATGRQSSSIISDPMLLPPLAIDRARTRFAVATESAIDVIEFDLADFPVDGNVNDQPNTP